jgi:sulfoxide reductase heme-binding subunit YedZ
LLFVGKEILLRIYLTIGFTAILGLVTLGVTSTDGMIRRMGSVAWNRVHRLVYVIGGLALTHYYMQAKADVTQPVFMSGFFFWLMGYRILAKYGPKQGLAPLAILSAAAALTTAVAEAAWYGFVRPGIGFTRVFAANLDFSFQIRPAWWVLMIGLAVTVVAETRRRTGGLRMQARVTSAA